MIDPYRMVFINIVASLFVLLGTLIYRFIYPKKKINFFVLLLTISILPIISILRVGDYESGDFNIHIYRIMSFYDSLMEGNLMPSWAGELNATYGNPLFIFNYSLPYYIISVFHLIGTSFIDGMKIYLGLNLYLSGIFMYLWINKLTHNKMAAFASAIFYIFNPYHLIDIHFRATLGESTIFTLVPLLLFFITLFVKNKKIIYLIIICFISQLLFLAHPMIAGLFLIISLFYSMLIIELRTNFKFFVYIAVALFLGSFFSIYTWASFILFSPYVFLNPGGNRFYFDTLEMLLYSPWRFGFLFQGPNGELAPIIGYTQIFVILLAIFLLIKNYINFTNKRIYIFWLSVIFIILFFMSPFSEFIWIHFPFLMMLASNRLLLPIALATSVIAGYLTIYFSKNKKGSIFIFLLLIITISYTILNWGHRRVITEINDQELRKNVWISTVAEGTTAYFLNNRWADINNFWQTKLPDKHLEIIEGKANVIETKRTSTTHGYVLNAETPLIIQENTLYYPGWSLKSNNEKLKLYPGKKGIINAKIPKGEQLIELYYRDIPEYAITKMISGLSFLGLILIISIYLLTVFLPIHSISPGKRITQIFFNIKRGLRKIIIHGRK